MLAKVPHRLRKRVAARGCRRLPRPPWAERVGRSKKRLVAKRLDERAGTRNSPSAVNVLERGFTAATQFLDATFPDAPLGPTGRTT